jgi:hypothetical protein
METEAEIGAMLLLEAVRDKEEVSPRDFRGSVTLPTPSFWTSGLQNCEKINFSCCKPPTVCGNLLPRKMMQFLKTDHPQRGYTLFPVFLKTAFLYYYFLILIIHDSPRMGL